ncbi:MAG: hypothetical protein FJ395_02015 [Verrucomicrobia bacterium]|nr:hypothetical protein [Verrucomicrobiota bacterium]
MNTHVISTAIFLAALTSDAAWQAWTCRDATHVLRDEPADKTKSVVLQAASHIYVLLSDLTTKELRT